MTTRAVYIIGGASTGKSTFMAELLDDLDFGPLEDLHALPTHKDTVTLRGHRMPGNGLYLGRMREHFPGSDGLNRASSPCATEWLTQGAWRPTWLVSEGITLGTRRFLGALHEHTELLLVHLHCDEFVKELRVGAREQAVAAAGMRFIDRPTIVQKASFVEGTATRAVNLLADLGKFGAKHITVDTASEAQWLAGMRTCVHHLWGPIPP